jgi:hypothetical protein
MRTVDEIIKRWHYRMYTTSCYLTKDALYEDLYRDFETLVHALEDTIEPQEGDRLV